MEAAAGEVGERAGAAIGAVGLGARVGDDLQLAIAQDPQQPAVLADQAEGVLELEPGLRQIEDGFHALSMAAPGGRIADNATMNRIMGPYTNLAWRHAPRFPIT